MNSFEFNTFVDFMKPIPHDTQSSDRLKSQPINTPSSWLLLLLAAEIKSEMEWQNSLSMFRDQYNLDGYKLFRLLKPDGEVFLQSDLIDVAQQWGCSLGHLESVCLFRWFGAQLFHPVTLQIWKSRCRSESSNSEYVPLESDSRTLTAMQTVERAWSKYLDASEAAPEVKEGNSLFEVAPEINKVSAHPACFMEENTPEEELLWTQPAADTFEAIYSSDTAEKAPENFSVFRDVEDRENENDSFESLLNSPKSCDYCSGRSRSTMNLESVHNYNNSCDILHLSRDETSGDWAFNESLFSSDENLTLAQSDAEALLEFIRLQIIILRNNINAKKILSRQPGFNVSAMYKLLQNGNDDLPCAHSILGFLGQWILNVDLKKVQVLITAITKGESEAIKLTQLFKCFEGFDENCSDVLQPVFVASFLQSLLVSTCASERIKTEITLRNTSFMTLFEFLISAQGFITSESMQHFTSKIANEEDILLLINEFGSSGTMQYSEFFSWIAPSLVFR